ncbi:MAG: hypothetical protein ABL985_19670 [Casimicrobium sp.]
MKNNRLMPLLAGLLATCASVASAQSIQVLNQTQYAKPGDIVTFPVLYRASLPVNQSVAGVVLQVNPGGPVPLPVVTGMTNESLQVNSDCLLTNTFSSNGSVSWGASPSGFPNSGLCGSHTADYTLATYSGEVQSFGASGKIFFGVSATSSAGQTGAGVQICAAVPVLSITPPAPTLIEGDLMTLTVDFEVGVANNCGGFSVPVILSGPASLAPDLVSVLGGTCNSVPDDANSCTVIIQGNNDTLADGDKALTVSVAPAGLGAPYWMLEPVSTAITVLDNESTITVSVIRDGSETGPVSAQFGLLCVQGGAGGAPSAGVATLTWAGSTLADADDSDVLNGRPTTINVNCSPAPGTLNVLDLPVIDDSSVEGAEFLRLTVGSSTNNLAVAGSPAAVAQISDNDFYLGISTTTSNVTEGALINFLLQCGNGQSGSISNVTISFSGTYAPLPSAVSSSFNCASGLTIAVQTLDDNTMNGTRTLIATITQHSGGYLAVGNAPVNVADNVQVVIAPAVPVPALGINAVMALIGLLGLFCVSLLRVKRQ